MRRLLFILQVFLVMSLPVPQAAYAAIGFGRAIGLDLLHMIPMYILSDIIAFAVVVWVTRRYGRRGIARLLRPLPERFSRPFDRALSERRPVVPLPAMFATGYANLYLAALVTGLSPMRTLPSSLLGIAGDVFQFTGTVLLASLVQMLPFRGLRVGGAADPAGAGRRRPLRPQRAQAPGGAPVRPARRPPTCARPRANPGPRRRRPPALN